MANAEDDNAGYRAWVEDLQAENAGLQVKVSQLEQELEDAKASSSSSSDSD